MIAFYAFGDLLFGAIQKVGKNIALAEGFKVALWKGLAMALWARGCLYAHAEAQNRASAQWPFEALSERVG